MPAYVPPHTPITEAERVRWTDALSAIAQQSLEYRPDFPEVAAQWEAWWQFKVKRPLLQISVGKRQIPYWGKALHLLHDFDAWYEARFPQVGAVEYLGESLPSLRVDIGPVAIGALLGAPLSISEATGTTWQTPIIEEWDELELRLDPENRWWKVVQEFTERLAEKARGRFLVCTPDLTGAIDTLANLRHSETLCLDLYEEREAVIRHAEAVVQHFETVFRTLLDCILSHGAGMIQWTGNWSNKPHSTPTCDINALIGTADFQEVCMPSLRAQGESVGRVCFHLDGPDAARHAEVLARDPAIHAIQFVPGAGTPSALKQAEMLRKVQSYGKPVLVVTPFAEAEEMMRTLDPGGVALCIYDCPSEAAGRSLIATRARL